MSAKGKHTSGPWKVYHAELRPQFPATKLLRFKTITATRSCNGQDLTILIV